jgi:hypothetical protein
VEKQQENPWWRLLLRNSQMASLDRIRKSQVFVDACSLSRYVFRCVRMILIPVEFCT